jgi:hypothetical protein
VNLKENKEIVIKQSDLLALLGVGIFGYLLKEPELSLLVSGSLILSHITNKKEEVKQPQP